MKSLELKVNARVVNGNEIYEGTVTVPGLKPTKLVKKSDNTTQFSTRSGVSQAANNFAKNIGFQVAAPVVAKAAKRRTTIVRKQPPQVNPVVTTSN